MRRIGLGLLTAFLILASTPALASASSNTHPDPVGDTWVAPCQGDYCGPDVLGPPTLKNGDITRTYFAHNRYRIRIVMTARDANTTAAFDITNGRGQTLSIFHSSDNSVLVRAVRHGTFYPSRCTGVRHAVNLSAGTWALSVPRSCLHRPRIIRLEASTGDDDAYSRFSPNDGEHERGTSPWLRRGHRHR
jgi:hypothetical protein